jgi:putative ABC transport system permease protein
MNLDIFREISDSMSKNILRSVLTSFTVFWGIFIFIILLGSGNGLENGIRDQFRSASMQSLWIVGRRTSMPYKGFREDRQIKLQEEDYDYVISQFDDFDRTSYRFTVPQVNIISYKSEYGSYEVRTCHSQMDIIEKIEITEGRFINDRDEKEARKVTIISEKVRDALFKNGEKAIGKFIQAGGINFRVIGIFSETEDYNNDQCIYIPVSTGQLVYTEESNEHIALLFRDDVSLDKSEVITQKIRNILSRRLSFHPDDERAIVAYNNLSSYKRFKDMMTGIRIFVFIVGVLTIVAGIVGVSNIITISVKERTKEIGIRKAIGAKPWSVISTVLMESVIITCVSGYIGLLFGVMVLEIMSAFTSPDGFFKDPSANIQLALTATIMLIVAGAIAGLFPALRASKIKPIEALREE